MHSTINIKLKNTLIIRVVGIKRRIIRHGPSTLIISLPSNWAKRNQLKKGDELNLKDEGRKLVVETYGTPLKYSYEQNISELNGDLVKELLARVYEKGFDTVFLVHNNPIILDDIREKTSELIGYEIIEQNERSCIIQSIASIVKLDFEESLRKSFSIVKSTLEKCFECYKNSDFLSLKNLHLKNAEINRFCYFALRQLNREKYMTVGNSHSLHKIINLIAELGLNCKNLSLALSGLKGKNDALIGLMNLEALQFNNVYTYFYRPTIESANESYRAFQGVESEFYELLKEGDHENCISACLIYKISQLLSNLVGMRLDLVQEELKQNIDFL